MFVLIDANKVAAADQIAMVDLTTYMWDGDPNGGEDKFTATVTPRKSGPTQMILIIATDKAGAEHVHSFQVQVNHAPVAEGAVADGSNTDPGTLKKLSEDYDDLAVSTGFSTVGTDGHEIALVADNSGYFSDEDDVTNELSCRFNTRGANIFAEGYPQWESAANRRQLNLAGAASTPFMAKGTAHIDVWCMDAAGESSPVNTLTIKVTSDGSIH